MVQPTRPDDHLDFATGGGAQKTSPGVSLRSSGWSEGESPGSDLFNYIQNMIGQWLEYGDQTAVKSFETLIGFLTDRSRSSPSNLKPVGVADAYQTAPPFRELWSIDTTDAGSGGDYNVCCSDGVYVYAVNDDRMIKINPRTGTIVENVAQGGGFASVTAMITNGSYIFTLNNEGSDKIRLYRASDLVFWAAITPPGGEEFRGMAADADRLYTYDAAGKVKAWQNLDTTPVVDWTNTDLTGAAGTINAICTTGDVVYLGFDDFDPGSGAINMFAINTGPSPTGGTELYRTFVGSAGAHVRAVCCDESLVYLYADGSYYTLPLIWSDPTNNPAEEQFTATNATWSPTSVKLLAVSGSWMLAVSDTVSATTRCHMAIGRKPADGGSLRSSWSSDFDFSSDPAIRDMCLTVDMAVMITPDQGGGAGNKTIVGYPLPSRPRLVQADGLNAKYRAPFHGAVTEG